MEIYDYITVVEIMKQEITSQQEPGQLECDMQQLFVMKKGQSALI